jgi:bifunctional non-homologous end joining protein LigD
MSDIIKSADLYFREGNSDKVYTAQVKKQDKGYVVLFAYGRRGNSLTTGSKTPTPVVLDKALAVMAKLVHDKLAKGYKLQGEIKDNITLNVVSDVVDTGIRPQLLNECSEEDVEKYLTDDNWCAQEKEDGRRRMLIKRNGEIIATNRKGFVVGIDDDIIKSAQEIPLKDYIIDGEDMGRLVWVFDMPSAIGGYKDRYEELVKVTYSCKRLVAVETAWTTAEKRALFDQLKQDNAEGIVFKRTDAIYKPGRPASGGDQIKFKFCETATCIVTKANTIKRSISVAVFDDKGIQVDVGNVTVYPNQDVPTAGSIVEVKYLYYFEGGSLFQPVLQGKGDCTRDDMEVADCLLSKLKLKREEIDA